MSRKPVLIGTLPLGASFATLLTGRLGMVLNKDTRGGTAGVEVYLEKPDEEKRLHVGVTVKPRRFFS